MDGEVDEADPMMNAACGEEVGICTTGVMVCTAGELVCDGVQPAEETCNGLDDDCDGEVDEDTLQDFFLDQDGDGYGSNDACSACTEEECGEGTWVTMDGDCDETCDTCYMGAAEVCDGLDNNCNTVVDEDVRTLLFDDTDGDGYGVGDGALGCLDDEGNAPEGLAVEDGDCGPDDDRAYPGATTPHASSFVSESGPRSFDFDCDGMWTMAYPYCVNTGGSVEPSCSFSASYCINPVRQRWCGEREQLNPTSGTMMVGACRFTGPSESYTIECI